MKNNIEKISNAGYREPSAAPFFLFGFFYYLVSPYFLILVMADESLVVSARNFITIEFFDIPYFIDCLVILVSWFVGYILAMNFKPHVPRVFDRVSHYKILPATIFIFLLFVFFYALINVFVRGGVLFSGYENYDVKILGPFATIIFVSLVFAFYFDLKWVKVTFFLLFVMSSVILLGFGSRLFFLMGSISVATWFLATRGASIITWKSTAFGLIILLLVLQIGLWRANIDYSELRLSEILTIAFIEPLFTLASVSVYFGHLGGRPVIGLPIDLVSAVVNFVPSFIFPSKLEFMNSMAADGAIFSPFGASSLLLNLYKNFGYFYPIFVFLIGAYYGFMRKCSQFSVLYRSIYFVSLPLLMFYFFREGFVTVFKVFFYNAWIFPVVLIFSLYYIFSKRV